MSACVIHWLCMLCICCIETERAVTVRRLNWRERGWLEEAAHCTCSTLKPIVGIVLMLSPSFSLYLEEDRGDLERNCQATSVRVLGWVRVQDCGFSGGVESDHENANVSAQFVS